MAASFYIKRNDTAPSIQVILTDSAGKARPLPDNENESYIAHFNMVDEDGNVVVDHGTGVIVNGLRGIVAYTWQPGDTAKEGLHRAEFVITNTTNGQVETFPNTGYINVIVKADLA